MRGKKATKGGSTRVGSKTGKRQGNRTESLPASAKEESEDFPCLVCGELVRDADAALECDECGRWVHCGCEAVPINVYSALQEMEDLACFTCTFKCKTCLNFDSGSSSETPTARNTQDGSGDILALLKKIDDKLEAAWESTPIKDPKQDIQNALTQIQESMKVIHKDVVDTKDLLEGSFGKLQDIVKDGQTRTQHSVVEAVQDGITQLEEKSCEQTEINERKNNALIFGLPEMDSEREDFDQVKKLLNHELGLNHSIINDSQIYRIGRGNGNTPRPLKIEFPDQKTKFQLFKAIQAFNNANQNDLNSPKLFATVDRTQLQRQKHRDLVDDLKSRKEQGEDVVIKGNRIIPRPLYQKRQTRHSSPSRQEDTNSVLGAHDQNINPNLMPLGQRKANSNPNLESSCLSRNTSLKFFHNSGRNGPQEVSSRSKPSFQNREPFPKN